jgi:hypothetical protein
MRRLPTIALGLTLGLLLATTADAQSRRYYPGGYGGYGWGGWGADPQSGYMAGLGAYARGAGVYQLDQAQANSINADTMIKWNNALRARQKALREDQQKEAAQQEVEREGRVAERRLEDGTTLNGVLAQILDFDPGTARSGAAKVKLSPAAIREIPFEWNSEALTICLDQMTTRGAMPDTLMDPAYTPERDALRAAVEEALKEDRRGDVSERARRRITEAIAAFRAKYKKNGDGIEEVVSPAMEYFNTLGSLVPMLNDPSMKKILARLEDEKGATIGDLVVFMNAYNLRFGPATAERQIGIYRDLLPILTNLRDSINVEGVPQPPAPDRTGEGLRSAAKGAFKGMTWDQLEAHSKNQ